MCVDIKGKTVQNTSRGRPAPTQEREDHDLTGEERETPQPAKVNLFSCVRRFINYYYHFVYLSRKKLRLIFKNIKGRFVINFF